MTKLSIKKLYREVPVRLTDEEFIKYYQLMKDGNEIARDQLIERNINLVLYIVLNKYKNTTYDTNDLIQIGLIGLIKAVDSYNIKKGVFSTYAGICIQNEINQVFVKSKRRQKTFGYRNIEINVGDLRELDEKADMDYDIEYNYENKELYDRIKKIISTFSQYEQEIMNLYFYKYKKQKEISEIYNVSQATISRIMKNNLEIISKTLQEEGFINEPKSSKRLMTRNK